MSANVRIATPDDRDQVIETVVAAFVNDPAFRYFFPDDARYAPQARTFAGYLFDKRVVHHNVWVVGDADAVSLWSPPERIVANELHDQAKTLRESMVEAVDRLECSVACEPSATTPSDRLRAYDTAVDRMLPSTPYWYLGVLAAHPRTAGSGLGRVAMQAGLDHVRSLGGIAYLETTNPSNVEYYERNGWRLVDTSSECDPLHISVLAHDGTTGTT